MKRSHRLLRWLLVLGASGVLPAFIMRCDKAALNFQRGLFRGLGEDVGALIISQLPAQQARLPADRPRGLAS